MPRSTRQNTSDRLGSSPVKPFASIADLEDALLQQSYLPQRGLATALFLSLAIEKPLLLEGEAGVGKTELAKALAKATGARLIRLQCYEGLDVSHAVYEWNYARQLLHIRAAQEGSVDEQELFGPDFLIRRPLLEAIASDDPAVLLVDEIDRADDEFEAFLLEVLSDFQITIPEIGTMTARRRPAVVLTSNRHARAARRAQAPLPVSLDHPPVAGARDRDRAPTGAGGLGAPIRADGRVRRRPARAGSRQVAGRRRDDRLDAGARGAGVRGARRDRRRADARRRPEVLRGLREAARRGRRGAGRRGTRGGRRRHRVTEALTRDIVTFGRVLRGAGLEVGPGRIADALCGLDHVDITRQEDVYWTLRTTLVARREDLDPFDRAFDAWFLRRVGRTPARRDVDPRQLRKDAKRGRRAGVRGAAPAGAEPDSIGHSAHEVLRTKAFAAMSPAEMAATRALIAGLATDRPERRSHRLRPHRRGRVLDLRALARASIATGGDPVARRFRRRVDAPRKLVVLCDVSGSMEAYSRALLLYLHAVVRSGRGVEVFAFGTRLTRLTPDLQIRDPEQALARAAERVVDWASGTRIGASLKRYNDVWGRRALSRGAVVLIASDGWERADHELVGSEMARLHRAAHTVVWVNPVKGSTAYQPLAAGMRAALPSIDRFVTGHNLASLEALGRLLAGVGRRHTG